MEHVQIAVVGGGPAGLRAAEIAAQGGAKVALFDAKPSVGRKFLVAGRGGLNLTHAEGPELFAGRYRTWGDAADSPGNETERRWKSLLGEFGPDELRAWAAGLGVETFAASTGRVYPREMKSAPLLRRWVERLRALEVQFRMRHRILKIHPGAPVVLEFCGNAAPSHVQADAVVLALGGGSWPETGSDGAWAGMIESMGLPTRALVPANCGWECDWPEHVREVCAGKPLKNVRANAGRASERGELLVTRYGLEGGALYALTPALREMKMPHLSIDFKPDSSIESLLSRLGTARHQFLNEARLRWRLTDAVVCLVEALNPPMAFATPLETVKAVKECPITLSGPRPIAEAISSGGGVCQSALNDDLMASSVPGLFFAGEMLDWEAPTGGYLMQGCFASGTRAGKGVLRWIGIG